jgi:hypothetical protein
VNEGGALAPRAGRSLTTALVAAIAVPIVTTFAIGTLSLAACGNGNKTTGATEPVKPTPPPPPGPTPEEELAAAQTEMCETLGPRITECALAEARNNLPPQEVAELEEPGVLRAHTREVINGCMSAEISVRQDEAATVCITDNAECAPLLDCIEGTTSPRGEDGAGAGEAASEPAGGEAGGEAAAGADASE